jgi:tryptophanyl-tRNA synthetase
MKNKIYLEKDYEKIKKKYNIQNINPKNKFLNKFIKNEFIVGHWNLDKTAKNLRVKDLAIVAGLSLSGKLHLGNKLVIDIANDLAREGTKLFIPISDTEAILTRKPQKDINKNFNVFLKDLIKCGVDIKRAEIYLHSDNKRVQYLLLNLLRNLKISDFERIYGKNIDLPEIFAISNMIADVFYPFEKNCRQIAIILGVDEIKHAELIRFLSQRLRLVEPIFLFTKILNGLKNDKMSKSKEKENILISDSPWVAKNKLIKNSQKQRFKNICDEPVYQIAKWCLNIDKKELNKLSRDLSHKEFVYYIGNKLERYYKNGFK